MSNLCLNIIDGVFARVSKAKNLSARGLDVLAGLTLLLSNLNGPGTALRRLSCDMGLQVAAQPKVWKEVLVLSTCSVSAKVHTLCAFPLSTRSLHQGRLKSI